MSTNMNTGPIDIGAYYYYYYNPEAKSEPAAALLTVQNDIAGSITLIVALVGLLANAIAIALTLKTKGLNKNVFAKLYLSMAVADVGVVLINLSIITALTYAQPARFYFNNPLAFPIVAALYQMLYAASAFSALAIAANRYVAMLRPTSYADIFNSRTTRIVIGTCWVLGVLVGVTYFVPQCSAYYMPAWYTWLLAATPCASIYNWIYFAITTSIGLATLTLNVAAFVLLRRHSNAKLLKTQSTNLPEAITKRKKEAAFLAFSCICTFMFVLCEISIDVLALLWTNKWALLFTSSIIPSLMYVVDPIAYVLLYKEMRETLFRACKRNASSNSVGVQAIARTSRLKVAVGAAATQQVSTV